MKKVKKELPPQKDSPSPTRSSPAPKSTRSDPVTVFLGLQRTLGNQGVQRLLFSGGIIQRQPANQRDNIIYLGGNLYMWGPFVLKQGNLYFNGKPIPIADLKRHYKDLDGQERFQKKLIGKLQQYLKTNQTRNLSTGRLIQTVYDPLAKRGTTAGSVTVAISKTLSLAGWKKIGVPDLPPDKNPFYHWAVILHEQVHTETVSNRLKAPFIKHLNEIKNNILTNSEPGLSAIKKKLNAAKEPDEILKIILEHPELNIDNRWLRNKFKECVEDWEDWINQAHNYAQDDIKAYRVSIYAIQQAKKFIRLALTQKGRIP